MTDKFWPMTDKLWPLTDTLWLMFRLLSQLEERVEVVSNEINNLEGVDRKANELADK